jgi:mRNA-degrading endonuclease RelE of RelBE toxin-antitoxin system
MPKGQLQRLPRNVRDRLSLAIDEWEGRFPMEQHQGAAGEGVEGRLRKRVGPYRIIFRKIPDRGVVEISAILVKSKGTYR